MFQKTKQIVIFLLCLGGLNCLRFPVSYNYGESQAQLLLAYNLLSTSQDNRVPYTLPVSGAKFWLLGSYGVSTVGTTMIWADQSGNGLDAVSVGALRPTQQLNSLNGHGVLNFNGTQRMSMGYLALAQPNSLFLVARRVAAATINTYFDGDANRHNLNHLAGGNYSIYAGVTLNGAVISAAPYRVIYAAYNGGSSVLGIDGFADTNGNTGAQAMGTPMIGADSNGAYQLVGDIAEIIAYNRLLTAGERTTVTNYLKSRYGI
ncbi:MAG: hypothetical protein JNM27_02200 [Leptospirales bacterium]|nr:hypothetical protein [Leptospirales bacterium]